MPVGVVCLAVDRPPWPPPGVVTLLGRRNAIRSLSGWPVLCLPLTQRTLERKVAPVASLDETGCIVYSGGSGKYRTLGRVRVCVYMGRCSKMLMGLPLWLFSPRNLVGSVWFAQTQLPPGHVDHFTMSLRSRLRSKVGSKTSTRTTGGQWNLAEPGPMIKIAELVSLLSGSMHYSKPHRSVTSPSLASIRLVCTVYLDVNVDFMDIL